MGPFSKALAGSFAGKICGTLFIAVCLALGFGPDKWATFIVQDLPQWITPRLAQIAFVVFALLTAILLFWPLIARLLGRPAGSSPSQAGDTAHAQTLYEHDELISLTEAARFLYENSRQKSTLWGRAAERLSGSKEGRITDGSPDEILDWIATYIRSKAHVFGSRPPSARQELIVDKHGHFEDGALIYKTSHHVYTNLAIEKRELQNLLAMVMEQ